MQRRDQTMDQTCPRTGLETRCPAFGVYASCPKLFLGRLVGPYAYVYGSCPCRRNQRQMSVQDMQIATESDLSDSKESIADLLASEFTCHCCYEVFFDPTTLTCGHSFCRHCLARWWISAFPCVRTDCPECRATWQVFPKINIVLRDAVEKLFPADVSQRKQAVLRNPLLSLVLHVFQCYGNRTVHHAAPQPVNQNLLQINLREIQDRAVTVLICLTMMVLVYRAFTADPSHETLLSKPLNKWSVNDVTLWVEHLGVWTNQYKETFRREQINGRSLSALINEDLSAAPFMIENRSHRRFILEELHRLKKTRVTWPQTFWEYKDVNPGMTLFLLVSLRNFPRLTLLYLYVFDYDDAFLPFIKTVCASKKPLDAPKEVVLNSSLYVLLWPQLPLFIINIEIYSRLYFSYFIAAALVKKTLQTVGLLRP
ncbi:Bifunctional apoptosis regulator [Anabarilius grahami]|uniref:Bifunctional apoptosis regulator n=1 Tax=Anabarilius grahami TaxID=495550 RepID=A0A3N0Y1J1_ANAGA|nr:Bifunctional apoptosis regulator [Anabarilius grahami]